MVVDVLVADRDPRVVPILARIVGESEHLGPDHEIVLETLAAMGTVGSEQAVPVLATVIVRRAVFRRRKLRALKERGAEGAPGHRGADRAGRHSTRRPGPATGC